jgi:hypothetical protein
MKTFPIKLPDDLWLSLSKSALDAGKSLQQHILDTLAHSVTRTQAAGRKGK